MSSCYKYLVRHFSISEHFSLQWNARYHVYLQQHHRLLLSLFLLVLDQQVLQRHDHLNYQWWYFVFLQVRLYDPRCMACTCMMYIVWFRTKTLTQLCQAVISTSFHRFSFPSTSHSSGMSAFMCTCSSTRDFSCHCSFWYWISRCYKDMVT